MTVRCEALCERRSPDGIDANARQEETRLPEHPATTGEPDDLPQAFAANEEGLPERVFSLRQKLYRKVKHEPKFRFYALYDRVYRWDKLKEMTDASQCFTPIRPLTERINRMLRGWQGYFSQGYPADTYRDVDSYTLRRLCTHLGRRSPRAYKRPAGVTWWAHLQRLGWTPLQKRPVQA